MALCERGVVGGESLDGVLRRLGVVRARCRNQHVAPLGRRLELTPSGRWRLDGRWLLVAPVEVLPRPARAVLGGARCPARTVLARAPSERDICEVLFAHPSVAADPTGLDLLRMCEVYFEITHETGRRGLLENRFVVARTRAMVAELLAGIRYSEDRARARQQRGDLARLMNGSTSAFELLSAAGVAGALRDVVELFARNAFLEGVEKVLHGHPLPPLPAPRNAIRPRLRRC